MTAEKVNIVITYVPESSDGITKTIAHYKTVLDGSTMPIVATSEYSLLSEITVRHTNKTIIITDRVNYPPMVLADIKRKETAAAESKAKEDARKAKVAEIEKTLETKLSGLDYQYRVFVDNYKFSIRVNGYGNHVSAKTFPMKKDGTHNWTAIYDGVKNANDYFTSRDAAAKATAIRSTENKTLLTEFGLKEYYGPIKLDNAGRMCLKIDLADRTELEKAVKFLTETLGRKIN